MLIEERKNESTPLEGSAFGRVLAKLMRSRGMSVDAETVEWLADGAGLIPEDLKARMRDEASERIGSLGGLRSALTAIRSLSEAEERELALAFALGVEDGGEQAPRCRMGSKTDKPCWRDAVMPRFADEDELRLCAEHSRLVDLNNDLEDMYMNLQAIDAWTKGPVAEARNDDLTRLAHNARDEARRQYGILAIRARAARMVADRGPLKPGEVPAFLEREDELARYMLQEEMLNNARSVLEDADEDGLALRDRWAAIDALALAATDAHEEVVRLREELGVSE